MNSVLETLAGRQVKIDQTGDSSGKGRLVNIQTDYASIWRDQQITHYPYPHIKSVSINVTETPEIVPVPDVTFPTTFADLLETLLMKKVRVENGDGSREGVLSALESGHMSLVVDSRELTFYSIQQIKNISPYYKIKSEDPSTEGNGGHDAAGGNDSASRSSGEKNHNHEESKSASSNTQDKSSSGSSNTQDKSRADSNYTRSIPNNTSPNMFNEKLASSMLDRLEATYFSSRKRSRKSTGSSKSKTRTTVGTSAKSPSFIQKLRAIRQIQNGK